MKPVFHAGRVNGPFDDPSLYVRILRESRALLFDAGDLRSLDTGNILRISDVFITHTHIDHFIGIDSVFRAVLRRDEPLRIFGPKDIIGCVEGKLKGYTWNLIRDYPIRIDVFEIEKEGILHSGFYAENSFSRVDHPAKIFDSVILKDSLFTVKALRLSHDIPVLAYSLEEEYHININKALLQERGLPVGPWLSDFKKAIRAGAPSNQSFEVEGRLLNLNELMPIATITRGQKFAYVVDVSPEEENISQIVSFVAGSDVLFCEAYFLSQDFARARERHHLTSSIAGRIAREAGVGNIEVMHISPKYRHSVDDVYREVQMELGNRGV
jgi:ribonuclease Z